MTLRTPHRTRHRIALLALLVAGTLGAAQVASRSPGRADGGTVDPVDPLPAASARIEVAFVLDATGSMSGLIEGAKRRIWEIADRMRAARQQVDLRVALVAYRDRGDDFVTRRLGLTDDLDALFAELTQIQAAGGGDGPESVNQALHEAVESLGWSRAPGVYRAIFLVGDAPPHMDYADDVPWHESVARAAARGIVVNTIQCGSVGETTPVWRAIAGAGQGRYAAIAQDGAMAAVTTPVDDALARLNRELAATVVPYGDAQARRELEAKRDLALDAPAPAAASRLGYLAREGRVNAGRRDLLDAVKDGLVKASELAAEALPEPLRALDAAKRDAWVARKLEERRALQTRAVELAREREAHLEAARARRAAGGEAAFDDEVLATVRAQAAEKGITYE